MAKEMSALKFYFKNGETWLVNRESIGDLWIKHVTTSYGRIGKGDFQKIHPCESLKIEVLPEADHVDTGNINLGGLEQGMFGRVRSYQDIEKMDFIFEDGQADTIYFPFKAIDADGMDNAHQSSIVAENGNLYIVIDPLKTVHDVYGV